MTTTRRDLLADAITIAGAAVMPGVTGSQEHHDHGPDPTLQFAQIKDLPRLPLDGGGPVFAEPWQATVFALAVRLSAEGHFTWKEWAATLADELKLAAERGEPDDGSRYYQHWLAALERLVVAKRLSDPATLLARKEAWAEAYRHTPHGKPVELENESARIDG